MFWIKKDNKRATYSLFISGKKIELQYCCQCQRAGGAICKLDDLKSETAIDFPNGIELVH